MKARMREWMGMHGGVHDAMRTARGLIKALAPSHGSSRLGLDLRAALLNLDDALARALGHDGDDMVVGADHMDVYSRLASVHEAASADSPESLTAVKPLLALLERRQDPNARRTPPPRPGDKR